MFDHNFIIATRAFLCSRPLAESGESRAATKDTVIKRVGVKAQKSAQAVRATWTCVRLQETLCQAIKGYRSQHDHSQGSEAYIKDGALAGRIALVRKLVPSTFARPEFGTRHPTSPT